MSLANATESSPAKANITETRITCCVYLDDPSRAVARMNGHDDERKSLSETQGRKK